jgi:hypothetical protein
MHHRYPSACSDQDHPVWCQLHQAHAVHIVRYKAAAKCTLRRSSRKGSSSIGRTKPHWRMPSREYKDLRTLVVGNRRLGIVESFCGEAR